MENIHFLLLLSKVVFHSKHQNEMKNKKSINYVRSTGVRFSTFGVLFAFCSSSSNALCTLIPDVMYNKFP